MHNLILILVFFFSCKTIGDEKHSHEHEVKTIKEFSKDSHDEHDEDENEDEHDHETNKVVGPSKAIVEINHEKGFKLSNEAIQVLGIKLESIQTSKFFIEKETLVTTLDQKGIYLFKDSYFKFVPVSLIKEQGGKYLVQATGLKFGDQIVTSGVGLLRVADVYSQDQSEYTHSH